jgi:uncharacterized protein YggE
MRTICYLWLGAALGCSTTGRAPAECGSAESGSAAAPWSYTVAGTASIQATPDVADLVVVLTAERASPSAAASEVGQQRQALATALAGAGVGQADIAVSSLRMQPVYEPIDSRGVRQRLRGYEASLTLTVTTRSFDALPGLMELAADAGATHLSSAFRVSDRTAVKQRAREQAARVAREKAESMARVLGIELGPIRAITESDDVGAWNTNFNANDNRFVPAAEMDQAHGEAEAVTMTVALTYGLR